VTHMLARIKWPMNFCPDFSTLRQGLYIFSLIFIFSHIWGIYKVWYFFWDMTLHHWEIGSWCFEATTLPWKVRNQLSSHTSLYPCRIASSKLDHFLYLTGGSTSRPMLEYLNSLLIFSFSFICAVFCFHRMCL